MSRDMSAKLTLSQNNQVSGLSEPISFNDWPNLPEPFRQFVTVAFPARMNLPSNARQRPPWRSVGFYSSYRNGTEAVPYWICAYIY